MPSSWLAKPAAETTPLTDSSGVVEVGYHACGCIRIRERRTAITVMLMVLCFSVLAKDSSNVALESALPAFEKYDIGGMGSHLVAILPGTCAVFYALGKGSAAILTYWFGGRNVLAYVQCLIGGLCALLVTTGVPSAVVLGAVGANFAVAHGWAATAHVVVNWVNSDEVGRTYAMFGLAGSGGSVLAAFAYGAILDVPPEGSMWRWMFVAAAGCMFLSAFLVLTLLRSSSRAAGFAAPSHRPSRRDTPRDGDASARSGEGGGEGGGEREGEERPHPLDGASLWVACGAFVRSPRCRLIITTCCGYAVATGVVYAFLPLYAVDALGASEGSAARLLTWLLVGGSAGGLGMGLVRDYASQRTVFLLTGLLNLLAAVAVSAWVWHEAGKHGLLPHSVEWLTMQTLGPLCFLIGASMEATWTIHVSVFQLRYGGHDHASTLCGLTDFLSFAFKAPFMFAVGASFERHEYGFPVALVAATMLTGHACIMAFFLLEPSWDDLPTRTAAESAARRSLSSSKP